MNFSQWRTLARRFLADEIQPHQAQWTQATDSQQSLFEHEDLAGSEFRTPKNESKRNHDLRVPKQFIQEAKLAAMFRATDRWSFLYRILWRITHGEPHLLNLDIDPDIYALRQRCKAVSRDRHKMKAFVRFQQVPIHLTLKEGSEFFIAWFEPHH